MTDNKKKVKKAELDFIKVHKQVIELERKKEEIESQLPPLYSLRDKLIIDFMTERSAELQQEIEVLEKLKKKK